MNDQEMRSLLEEIIQDVDQGRVHVQYPRALKTAGTVLAAALGLGLAACSGPAKRDVNDPGDNRPRTSQADAGARANRPTSGDHADPRPRPPDTMKPEAPVPAYGVPIARPKPPKQRPMDPGPTPDYGVP